MACGPRSAHASDKAVRHSLIQHIPGAEQFGAFSLRKRVVQSAPMRMMHELRLVLLGLLIVGGCSYANRRLNDPTLLLEQRQKNKTRSAVFADVAAPQELQTSPLRTDRIVRASKPDFSMPRDQDGTFVGLAISGGGSRSANFSAACMFQLERVGLLQHVDYISSVSGGSVVAAYYCTNGSEWNPKDVQHNLTRPFASMLLERSLFPWNQVAFYFSDYDRSDVLAGVFSDTLFNRYGKPLTYADLRHDRPRLLINATDLQTGRRFVFCNETFDQLNSNLSEFPIGYAVAASAAVPVVLHPVTLRDFSTTFQQYRHLIDGGVSDNLGVQTLIETYSAQIRTAQRSGRSDPYPNGAVLIVLDASTRFNPEISSESDVGIIESVKAAVGLSTSLVNRTSSATMAETIVNSAQDQETAAQLREQIRQLNDDGFLRMTDRTGHPVRVIYITLSQVNKLPNLPFTGFSEALNSIGTYFNISPSESYHLYEAADLLMREKFEPNVREVVNEIEHAERPSTRPSH